MTTVWVVEYIVDLSGGCEVVGVFATEEAANAFLERQGDDRLSVTDWEVCT